ncbi:phosphopentomutase [Paenibacillus planticolens]|uniref:Phosphopentomutase n=1 Tax=Paenibacillus planticolens TaxID=2654976 RepID=A0ABX1ZIB9_9BACL|nr:phosphopentomutase [Paenibacillus planticolens]NOU99816.1 phosphopentomutase [Paenibacillus planticolens]
MLPNFERIFLIVLDSVGIGELPDASQYNDTGAHTLAHIAETLNGLHLPNMAALGLGNIEELQGVPAAASPKGLYGKMNEISIGKDTTTGHWELMGLKVEVPFQTYPQGFPAPLIQAFEQRIGRKVIGNIPASGTEILDEYGKLHVETGDVIVYTSADSVLQIAAHEDIVPLDELYRICEIARELTLVDEYFVGRVIARPFTGEPGAWVRTSNRRDYSVKPLGPTVLNALNESDFDVIGIGKISDIYAEEGITQSIKSKSNMDGVDKLLQTLDAEFNGLCFTNLVDFDALYGHRRDPKGYGQALEQFDVRLPEIYQKLRETDLLILTADHGNDPTHHGTDHTREYVPLLVYHHGLSESRSLGIRNSFADVGATIADNFKVTMPLYGTSFLSIMK